jgi:phosphodiesterase/alkaline phosphatase D-like protein
VQETSLVKIFGPAVVQADVTSEAASKVTPTGATLNGTVNPDGLPVTTCQFEYGTSQGALPQTIACSPSPGAGSSPVAVSANLAALAPGTTYYFRLAATNANGTNRGQEETFAAPPAVEGVSTGPAEEVTQSSTKLTGSLSSNGTDAHYYFQYGTTASYGSTSPAPPGTDAGAGGSAVAAETTLSGLAANTIYHYRLLAVNANGTTAGEDREFITAGPPRIRGEAAEVKSTEKAGQTTATLQAQVDAGARETTYHFEYGQTTAYGTSVPLPAGTVGPGQEFVSVPAAELSNLKVATTYHYRIVAHNEYGTTTGPDREFSTVTAALIEDSFASNVGATSATLAAHILTRSSK